MSRRSKPLAVAIAALVPLGVAASAQAAPPMPFTITENVIAGTFTATGPLCPSGTFADDTKLFAGRPEKTGEVNIINNTVYTCDNGSGSFNALKVQHITFSESGLSGTGRIELHGGTGAYVNLRGAGVDNGFINFDTGESAGNIAGLITSL